MTLEPSSSPKPPCHRDDALAVLRRLREAGHVAYFAGGCVRDSLLGQTAKDFDVATDAPPQRVRELFSNTQAVGQAFGVILVKHGRSTIEVATFRCDGAYLDGRRPQTVRFTTAEEDARRRDFTINGLFLDPIDNRVIDYVGGQDDLTAHVIRAIGEASARFAEDHLRLLRAVRFAARLGFDIEPNTAQAMQRHADELKRISPERIGEEVRLMFTAPTRAAAWRLLGELHLLPVIFRFLPRGDAAASSPLFARVVPGKPISLGLALAAATLEHQWPASEGSALPDICPLLERGAVQKSVKAMRQALKISNDVSDEMAQTLEGLAPLLSQPPPVATVKRFLARVTSPQSLALLDALRDSAVPAAQADDLTARIARWQGTDVAPPPLLNGDDLTAAGYAPGPAFRRVLDAVYDAQLEDRVTGKDAAMAMGRQLLNAE